MLQIPPNLPCSVTLQPGPEDTGKVRSGAASSCRPPVSLLVRRWGTRWVPCGVLGGGGVDLPPSSTSLTTVQACGVDYEVKAFCAENLEEKIHKR